MPIEARRDTPSPAPDQTIGRAYIDEARDTLAESLRKITHCLDQLADADVQWRPHESHNSVQNILLHLCGNVRQWIVHGVGGAADVRNRPQEFAERRPIAKSELVSRLEATVVEADVVLAALEPKRLLESRRIQAFDTPVLAAIFDCVSHFVGHTHQIVYITRLRLGDAYRFQWAPAMKEQGATA